MSANHAHPADNLRLPTGNPLLVGASEPVPEADRLEQLTPVDPAADQGSASAPAGPTSTVGGSGEEPNGPVDEGDWLEQQLTVPAAEGYDEDYPPDLSSTSRPIIPNLRQAGTPSRAPAAACELAKEKSTMTNSIQKPRAQQTALESMSIRELLVALASLEDERSELADASDSGTAAALAADRSAWERAIKMELRHRRLALRERG